MEHLANQDLLLGLAQLSLALAGFAGLISTLGARTTAWSKQEIMGVKLVLECSFGAGFLSIMPLIIYSITNSEIITWKISAGVSLSILAWFVWLNCKRIKMLRSEKCPPRMEWGLSFVILPISLICISRACYDLFMGNSLGGMLIVFWMLIVSGVQLAVFLSFFKHKTSD